MVRFEKDRFIIEIDSQFPFSDWLSMMNDLITGIGILNKEMLDPQNDCTYGMTNLLQQMLPDENTARKMCDDNKKG